MEEKILKQLINRLIEWLETKGLTDTEIKDCINYITKQTVVVATA